MKNKSVHICEDHQIVVEGIEHILAESERYAVRDTSKSIEECRTCLSRQPVDILVLDLQLPDGNGLDLLRDFREHYPKMLVLVLTMHNDPFLVDQIQKNGGHGFLLKDFGKKEFTEALDKLKPDAFYKGPGVKSYSESDAFTGSVRLTEREKEIISLTARGKTSQEISQMLFISEHTANTHKRNIYKKLGLHDSRELTKFAYDNGLV